jgi:hypothetical protein
MEVANGISRPEACAQKKLLGSGRENKDNPPHKPNRRSPAMTPTLVLTPSAHGDLTASLIETKTGETN